MNRARIAGAVASVLVTLILLPFTAPFQTFDLDGPGDAATHHNAQTRLVSDDDGPAALPIVIERWRLTIPSLTAEAHASFFSLIVTARPADHVVIDDASRPRALDGLRI